MHRDISFTLVHRGAVLAACLAATWCGSSAAQSFTWTGSLTSGTYDWNSSSNWAGTTSGTFPNAAGAAANMYVNRTGTQTLNLNQQITVGTLTIGDTGTASGSPTLMPVIINAGSAGGGLTINSNAAGVSGTIAVRGGIALDYGGVTINADIALASDVTLVGLDQNKTAPLTVNGIISDSGGSRNVTLNGGSGSQKVNLVLNGANTYSGTTSLTSGAWVSFQSIGDVNGGASALGAPTTAEAGTIRVGTLSVTLAARLDHTGTAAASTNRRIDLVGRPGTTIVSSASRVTLTNSTPFTWSGTGVGSQILQLGNVTVNGVIGDLGGPTSVQAYGANANLILLGLNTFTGKVGELASNSSGIVIKFNSIADIGQASALGSGTGANADIILGGQSDKSSTLQYIGTAPAGHASNRPFVISMSGIGGTLDASGAGPLQLSGSVYVGSGATAVNKTLTLGGTSAGSLSGAIVSATQSVTVAVAKSGAGSWTLSGANTYTGTTRIDAGTLTFAKRTSLYSGSAASWTQALINTATNGAATLGLGVGGADGFTNGDVTTLLANLGTGTVSVGGMRATSSWGFDTTNTGSTFTINDTIANTTTGGGAIGVAKLGSGTLSLGGDNTFTYGTRIDGGTLLLGHINALGTGTAFVQFNGGTLDMGGLAITRSGSVSATAGGLTNGVLAGTSGLTKTGTGTFAITTGSSTFTGATNIQEGVVEVAVLSNSGAASSLGAPTTNATISLGNAATSGTFRYLGTSTGSTNRTFNLAGTTGGGGIDASGAGALTISSLTSGSGSKTFTLSGTSTAANSIGLIPNPTSTGSLSVVKDGPGLWRLTASSTFTGPFTIKNGTILAAADSSGTNSGLPGAFGNGNGGAPTVGDTSGGATGTAALLAGMKLNGTGVNILGVNVATGGGTQKVLLGGGNTSGTSTFVGGWNINLGRPVTLVASTGGVVSFENNWKNGDGSGGPTVDVTFGAAGYTGTVQLSGTLATSGSVAVRYGTAVLGPPGSVPTLLDGAGVVMIDSGATLGGVGRVAATLGGSGLVGPGNSPGILTAEAVDASGGLDWAFEFSGTAAPNYASLSNSLNDVLRLTGTSPFMGTNLGSGNVVNIYLPSTTAPGDVFLGGFFADNGGSFTALIDDATYNYWVAGSGTHVYNSGTYAPLSTALSVSIATASQTSGTFANGDPVSGQVTTFTVVVPEPAAIALAAVGVTLVGLAARRRRITPSGRRAA